MRLQFAFVAVITSIAAGTSDVAAATDTTLIVSGPPTPVKALDAELTARNGRRLLRNYKAADEDKDGEEQFSGGALEETHSTLYKPLFPAWYAAGKTPETVFVELQSNDQSQELEHV
ncbi:hypothetical protein PI124_g11797 [Phytophthora idaei]|nr:hypothetical protein PI125_g11317 [Phytophthora idaei]KAG3152454.1 hypothetical protein PI126_g10514 [Phytophthora idaei]KAG3243388.1 hypothetical protein PI124_g11797 [Phytophthora idaei]